VRLLAGQITLEQCATILEGTIMLSRVKCNLLLLATVLVVASCNSSGLNVVSTSTLDRTLPSRLLNNTDAPQDGRVNLYETWDIPHFVNPNPNLATMRFYLQRHINDPNGFGRHQVSPGRVSNIARDPRENSYLTQQMNSTALVSYLLYENDQIVYDVLSPRNRFGDIVNNTTRLRSASIGKSFTSYLLGHAICAGYIEGLDARLDDWPLIQNTVYDNQRLIDLVNMRAGDEEVVDDIKGLIASGRWYNLHSIGSFSRNELAGTEPRGTEGRRPYHYNGLGSGPIDFRVAA
jgi:CubicO group peptidase (beta-lactamase class C family)